jgi:hypothetical protein
MSGQLVVETWEKARADAYANLLRQVLTHGIDGAEQVAPVADSLPSSVDAALRATAYAMYRAITTTAPWVAFAPGASWAMYDTIHTQTAYRALPWGDWELRGFITGGLVGVGHSLVTLPAAARPRWNMNFPLTTDAGQGRLEIYPDGTCVVLSGGNGWVSLDGVRWSTQ